MFAYIVSARATVAITVLKWEPYTCPVSLPSARVTEFFFVVFINPGICFPIIMSSLPVFASMVFVSAPSCITTQSPFKCLHPIAFFRSYPSSFRMVLLATISTLKKSFCEPTRHAILFISNPLLSPLFFVCPNFSITHTSILDSTAHSCRMSLPFGQEASRQALPLLRSRCIHSSRRSIPLFSLVELAYYTGRYCILYLSRYARREISTPGKSLSRAK